MKGKIFGNDWRSNEYPQFAIVANNADADTEFGETDEGDNSVEMDTAMVILPPTVELSDLISDTNEALGKVDDAVSKTDEAVKKANDAVSQVNGALEKVQNVDIDIDGTDLNITRQSGEKKEFDLMQLKGDKGDPFTYNDFTEAEIKELQKPATDAANELNKYLNIVKLPVVEIPASGTAVAMDANKVYDIKVGESLTLTLNAPTDLTVTNEYQGSFDTGSTAPTVVFPTDVIWAETPQINKNTHYEFSIRYVDGKYYGVLYGWNLTNMDGI